MKSIYMIELIGCDATTYFLAKLTEEECELLKKIASFSKEVSKSNCEPRMDIMGREEWLKGWEDYPFEDEIPTLESFRMLE